ncbi:MAG TPA: PKD domain-containing protein [Bacteroidia bacterium]|nr:PKD domain-containing protein [Bacteroidia bacterium]
MKKTLLVSIVFILVGVGSSFGQQDWASMMRNPKANLKDVQSAFNQWYAKQGNNTVKEKDKDNGDDEENGRTLFKRWEWLMQARTFPSGNMPDQVKIATDYQDFLNTSSRKSSHKTTSVASWTYLGNTSVPNNIPDDGDLGGDGRVSHVRFYPGNNNIMFACSPTGGLWKTTNGGTSWLTVTDQLGDLATSDVAINPLKPSVMYLATGDGDGINSIYPTVSTIGVLKSSDGGNTWVATGLSYTLASSGPAYATINEIFVNPSDTSIVVAATSFGMYYTLNSGTTWTQAVSEDFMSLALEPSHPSRVYASTYDGKFYTSSNGGKTYTQTTTGLPASGVAGRMAVAVSAADTNDVYVLATDPTNYAFYGLYLSTNHGTSFTAVSTLAGGAPNILGRANAGNDPTVGQGWYDLSMDVSPTNIDSIFVGGINIWQTGNGGTSWKLSAVWTGSGAPFVHADVHSLSFMPGSSKSVVATCDGGVFKTTSSGSAWTDLSHNLAIAQQYSIGPSSKTSGLFITGWQDNGTNLASSGTWTQNIGGDGMVCFIDYSTDANMYGENPEAAFEISTDNGATWNPITSGLTETGPWVTQWMLDPKVHTTVYCGLNNVWKSTNQGSSWSQISTWSSASITAMTVDSSNTNYIYAAQAGKLEYTSNGGTTWTDITGTLPVSSAGIASITVNPKKPTHVWVTFSGYSSGNKVFQSYNSGTTWTNISTGLPNLPVNAICYQPGTLEALYVGTDQGVYYHDSINGWVSYNTGLPNVMVGDVKVSMVDKTLYAGTYGRGTWRSPLFTNASAKPVAYFKASPTTVCTGASVAFTDTSHNSPTSWKWTFTGGTPASSTSQNPTVVYNTAGSYAVKLVVTNSSGSDSLTQASYITVNATPTVSANAASPTICSGSSTTLTASGGTTYSWSPSTGLTVTTGTPVTANPGSTQTYTVTGTTSGCSATGTVLLTVNTTPTLTASAAPSTICSGGSTTLTGSGASTYTWTPNTSLTATTGSSVIASPTVTITYTLNGTSASGCAATAKTVVVTVSSPPTLSAVAAPSTICSGSSTTLTGSNATTYTWTPGGLTGSTVSVSPGATTTYTLNGTASGCSPSPSQTVVVTVNATPTLVISGPATICSGNFTTLTGSGATTYTWTPNTSLSASTGASVSATPVSTITYTLNGTSSGCNAAPQTEVVTVNTTPTLTVSGPASICQGGSTTLTGSGAATYTWTPGGLTGSTVSVSPGSTTTYTLNGTSAAGCVASSAKTVVVTVTPTPTINASATIPVICAGSTTTLTVSGATTYTWQPGALSGSTVSVSPASSITYTVTGTTSSCNSATQTVAITVNPSPTVSIALTGASSICVGDTMGMMASGATTYTWAPAGSLTVSTGNYVVSNPIVTTTYTVTGSAAGCSGTSTQVITVIPTPTISVTPTSPSVCSGVGALLTASGGTTYSWSPATGLTATTGASVTANPLSTTTYTITGVNGSCSATDSVVVTINSSPTVAITPSGSTSFCAGDSVGLAASGAATYTWSPSAGLSSSTGALITAKPITTSTYTVTGINGSCSATQTIVINVSASPTVSVSPGSASVCSGSGANLTASGATTYSWLPVTGLSANTGASVVATPTVTTTYTVSGTTGSCSASQTVVITVGTTPTVNVTPPSSTICSGTNVGLTASGATTYSWSPATGLNKTTGTSVTASPTITITYTVTGTTGVCSDTQSVVVSVNPSPTLTVSPAAPSICSIGGSVTITASGASSYTWSPASGLNATSGAVVNANPSSTTTYTLTGSTGSCSVIKTIVVKVSASPTVAVTPSTDTLCAGSSILLKATGATTYSWSPSSGLSGTATANVLAKPATSTTYTVTGTSGVCSDTQTVAVIVNPLPVITSTQSASTICNPGGTGITIIASGGTSYTWAPATSLNISNGDSVIATPTVTTTYTLTGNNGTCSATHRVIVSVGTKPVLTTSPVNGASICEGSKAGITAGGATTYVWSPNTNITSTTGVSVTTSPTVTTTYSVTGTKGGCSATDSVVITVNKIPIVTISSPNDSLCKGSSITMTAAGANTYSWSPVTGLNSGTDSVVNAMPTVTTKYIVTGTTKAGCKDTQSIHLTVVPLPVITVTPTVATVCSGNSVTLNAGGANTYAWSPPTGLNTTIGSSVVSSPVATLTYSVLGTTAFGCSGTKTVKVTVINTPTVSVTPDSATLCLGGKTTLKAVGATGYVWSPATGLNSSTAVTVTATPTVSTTYTVIGTNGSGCNDTVPVSVRIVPAVKSNPTVHDTICGGNSTTLSVSGGTTYLWNDGATTTSITVSPVKTTTYTVTVGNGYCTANSTEVVDVNPITQPSIAQKGDTLYCQPAASFFNFVWSYNGTVLTGRTHDTLIVSKSGSYEVSATNKYGCSDTVSKVIISFVGINELSLSQFITIYPNPSNGHMQIQCNIPDGEYTIYLTDILGQVIHTENINVTGTYISNLDMSGYSSGIYIFKLTGVNSSAEKKIIITR